MVSNTMLYTLQDYYACIKKKLEGAII